MNQEQIQEYIGIFEDQLHQSKLEVDIFDARLEGARYQVDYYTALLTKYQRMLLTMED